MLRHDLGITIDTILTDLQIARVQSALKSGFVYVDGQTRRHSPFSFSIRGRSYQKSARVTQQESKGSSWFSSVQLIVRLSWRKNSVYTHFWLVSIKKNEGGSKQKQFCCDLKKIVNKVLIIKSQKMTFIKVNILMVLICVFYAKMLEAKSLGKWSSTS